MCERNGDERFLRHQLVTVKSSAVQVLELRQRHALHLRRIGRHHHVRVFFVHVVDNHKLPNGLSRVEGEVQVLHSCAPRLTGLFRRKFKNSRRKDTPVVCEKKQRVVSICHLHETDDIVVFREPLATDAFASTVLLPVSVKLHPFYVTILRESDHDIFMWLDVLPSKLAQLFGVNDGHAVPTVSALEQSRLSHHLGFNLTRIGEQLFQTRNLCDKILVLILQLLSFKRSKSTQLHVQYRLSLDAAEAELCDEVVARILN